MQSLVTILYHYMHMNITYEFLVYMITWDSLWLAPITVSNLYMNYNVTSVESLWTRSLSGCSVAINFVWSDSIAKTIYHVQ